MTIRKGKTIIAGNSSTGLEIGDIGISAIGIDESLNYRRYLNGQEILQAQFPEFTKKIKRRVELYPSLACSDYQYETYLLTSAHGQCGKFVIDDERGVIRLPKVVNVQGLSDMAEAGVTVDAGLPNITGGLDMGSGNTGSGKGIAFARTDSGSGALSVSNSGYYNANGATATSDWSRNVSLDASLSNPIYGNSETVQQEAIKYPYFIQVASSCETTINLTRDIELNNPFSLFEYKFSEYAIDNLSWLESKGQWNDGRMYVSAYEELLAIYNGKEREGISVKKTTDTYGDYDFVIDEVNKTFRLANKVLGASGSAVVGNGMALGLTNGTVLEGLGFSGDGIVTHRSGYYGAELGETLGGGGGSSYAAGVTLDPTKSGIELSPEGMKLYFYVGETLQDSHLINTGAILNDVNTLKNTALTTNQITNCITEIPQRVKYTLVDGTLTILKGSIIIVPFGVEDKTNEFPVGSKFLYDNFRVHGTQYVDGKFFVWTEIQNDIVYTWASTGTASRLFCIDLFCPNFILSLVNHGSDEADYIGTENYMLYHTTDNIVKRYIAGAYQADSVLSLPLGIVVADGTYGFGEVTQVFNGIGYIGATVWVDKGVKGYYPNGFDEKGAHKSTYFESKQFCIRDLSGQDSSRALAGFYLNPTGDNIYKPALSVPKYNPQKNIIEGPENNEQYFSACLGTAVLDPSSGIKDFTVHTPSKTLTSNDGGTIAMYAMPSEKYIDLTLGASGAAYVAPANGWVSLSKTLGNTQYISLESRGVAAVETSAGSQTPTVSIPVCKGATIKATYSGTGALNYFRFYYAEGEV